MFFFYNYLKQNKIQITHQKITRLETTKKSNSNNNLEHTLKIQKFAKLSSQGLKKFGELAGISRSTLKDSGIVGIVAMCRSHVPLSLAAHVGGALMFWDARDGVDQATLPLIFTLMSAV